MRGGSMRTIINEPPLLVLPSLAVALGDVDKAIIVQQLHFWLGAAGKERDGRRWVYNTLPAWQKQFPWMVERTVQRKLADLTASGIIISTAEYNRAGYDRTQWYTIDYARLEALVPAMDPTPPWRNEQRQDDVIEDDNLSSPIRQSVVTLHDKLSSPIPETSTENTTETNDDEYTIAVAAVFPGLTSARLRDAVKLFREASLPPGAIAGKAAALREKWSGTKYVVSPSSLVRNWHNTEVERDRNQLPTSDDLRAGWGWTDA